MISNLLFDLDGTLFDQKEADAQAYLLAFAEARVEFDIDQHRELHGLRFEERIAIMSPQMTQQVQTKIRLSKINHYKANLDLVKPNYGLLELLRSAKPKFSTALVTTASRPNALNLLKHFSVDPKLFDIIISGEDVNRGKPDPQCYNKAIKKLAAKPNECIVFEDSEIGVKAAEQSGAHVVKVKL